MGKQDRLGSASEEDWQKYAYIVAAALVIIGVLVVAFRDLLQGGSIAIGVIALAYEQPSNKDTWKDSIGKYGLIQVFQRLEYASNMLALGGIEDAILNLDFAWEELPTGVRDMIPERPSEEIRKRMRAVPSERDFTNAPAWASVSPYQIRREIESRKIQIAVSAVGELRLKMFDALSEKNLYLKGGAQNSKKNFPKLDKKGINADPVPQVAGSQP